MCHNAILPTTLSAEQFGNELTSLIYIFNRCLKMLTSYGKLDESGLDDDFTAISKVLKEEGVRKDIKRAVQRCRDYALSEFEKIEDIIRSLTSALKVLCKAQDNPAVKRIKKSYADQGMTEKYRPLTKRLEREKIRKIGRAVTSQTGIPMIRTQQNWCVASLRRGLLRLNIRILVKETVRPTDTVSQ